MLKLPIFNIRLKSNPMDMVKSLLEAVTILDNSGDIALEKLQSKINKYLTYIKNMWNGDCKLKKPMEQIEILLLNEFHKHDLLLLLVRNLHRIDFESKKLVTFLFNNLLRKRIKKHYCTVDYICTKPDILFILMNGYRQENSDIALNIGMMLRECARYESLAKIVLQSNKFFDLFKYIECPTFGIGADAFVTLKKFLNIHKSLSATFLENNYEQFFDICYPKLMHSESYATRRQSIKFLAQLLQNRYNMNIMLRYISEVNNLKIIMNLLNDVSETVQFETFHIFKLFAVNPDKSMQVYNALKRNQSRLEIFLTEFNPSPPSAQQFYDEKLYVIKTIQDL